MPKRPGPPKRPARRSHFPEVGHVCSPTVQILNHVLRSLSDNVNANSATMNNCHLPREEPNDGKPFFGAKVITGDTELVRGWDLLTHGGFLTYPHHDPCGLATYVTLRSGTKIWGFLDTVGSSSTSRESLLADWDNMARRTMSVGVPNAPLGTVVLRRGDTL